MDVCSAHSSKDPFLSVLLDSEAETLLLCSVLFLSGSVLAKGQLSVPLSAWRRQTEIRVIVNGFISNAEAPEGSVRQITDLTICFIQEGPAIGGVAEASVAVLSMPSAPST